MYLCIWALKILEHLYPISGSHLLPVVGREPIPELGLQRQGCWLPTGKDTGLSCNRALLCPQPQRAIIPMEKNVPATGVQRKEGDDLTHLQSSVLGARTPIASRALLGSREADLGLQGSVRTESPVPTGVQGRPLSWLQIYLNHGLHLHS